MKVIIKRHFAIILAIAALAVIWNVSITGPVSAAQQQNEERGLRRALPPAAFIYQGQMKDGGAPASGAYDFRFTLHTGQTGGEERGSIVSNALNLVNGFFKVELDFGAVGDGKESWLEIAVRPAGGAEPYATLSPRQRLTSAPYAIFAQQGRWSLIGVPVGFVDASGVGPLGEQINRGSARTVETNPPAESGGEKSKSQSSEKDGMPQQQPLLEGGWWDDGTVVRLTDGADRVGIGTMNPSSKLQVFTNANEAAGRFEINNTSNTSTALTVDTNGGGAGLRVNTSGTGSAAVFSSDSPSSPTLISQSGQGKSISSFSGSGIAVFGQTFSGDNPAGHFQIFNANSGASALFAETNGSGIGVHGNGRIGVSGTGSGAGFGVSGSSVGVGVFGSSANGLAGKFVISGFGANENPNPALEAITLGIGPAGRFRATDSRNSRPAIEAITDGAGPAVIAKSIGKGLGAAAVFAEAQDNSTGDPAGIAVYGLNHSGDSAIVAENTGEGDLFRGISNADQIVFAVRNNGTTVTKVLQITGGADLSENFEVSSAADAGSQAPPEQAQPGMVVSIDPKNPTKLVVSSRAYDRRVVGIISGAGGIKPGMLMSQTGTVADGEHPVALSSRVWVNADATNRAIEPGDLLTTAGRAGHAMKAADHGKAQGAIIGKAMTGLKRGTGLVLVLVSLQ